MTSYDQVALYEQAYLSNKKTLEDNGMVVNNPAKADSITLSQSKLRSEVFAAPGSTAFKFPILINDPSPQAPIQTPTSTEIRLTLQDVFFAVEIGFYIYCAETGSGNANWRYVDMAFPDPNLLGGLWSTPTGLGGPPDFNIQAALGLWNTGMLNVQVNNDTLTPLWGIKQHMVVPNGQVLAQAKYPPSTATSGGKATSVENTFNEINYNEDGLVNVWPNWVVNGGNNNQYVLTFPAPLATFGINPDAEMWFVLEMNGYLAQNASSIMKNGK